MISAGDFRNGVTFELDGNVVQVIEFQHVKPGGCAFVRTKYKNVITGAVVERSFNPTDKYPTAYIERKDMQVSGMQTAICTTSWTWKHMSSSPSTSLSWVRLSHFVKENMEVKVLSYKGNVFGVEPPYFVELEVTETDPGFKGDTATNATKPATLETGAEIKVPLFINQGDMIRIDTRTGEYMERA